MSPTIAARRNPTKDVIIVDCAERLQLGKGTHELNDFVLDIFTTKRTKNIILNLEKTVEMDGSGISSIVHAAYQAKQVGGVCKITQPQEKINKLLVHARIDRIVQIFDNEDKALESFTS